MDGSARRLGKPLIQKTQTEMGSREGVLTVLRYKSPREADEMGSVFAYLLSKVERAAEEVADGIRQLCRNTPSDDFWDLPQDERPAFGDVERIEDLEHTDSHIQGIAGFGPEFLCRMLHMDPISRRDTFIGNTRGFGVVHLLDFGLESPLTLNTQSLIPWIGLKVRISNTYGLPCHLWVEAGGVLPHGQENALLDSLMAVVGIPMRTGNDVALWDEKRLTEWSAPLIKGPFNTRGGRVTLYIYYV